MVQEQNSWKTKTISVKCVLTGWVLSAHHCELRLNQKGNLTVWWYAFYRHRLSVSSVLVGKLTLSPHLSTDLICKPNKLKFQTPGYTAAKRNWFIAIFMGYESIILNRIHSVPVLNLFYHSEAWKLGCKNSFWLWDSGSLERLSEAEFWGSFGFSSVSGVPTGGGLRNLTQLKQSLI